MTSGIETAIDPQNCCLGEYSESEQPRFVDRITELVRSWRLDRGKVEHRLLTFEEYRQAILTGLSAFERVPISFEEFQIHYGKQIDKPERFLPLLPPNPTHFLETSPGEAFNEEAYRRDLRSFESASSEYHFKVQKLREHNRRQRSAGGRIKLIPEPPRRPDRTDPKYKTIRAGETESINNQALSNARHQIQIERREELERYAKARGDYEQDLLELKAEYHQFARQTPKEIREEIAESPSYQFITAHDEFFDFILSNIPDRIGYEAYLARLAHRIPKLATLYESQFFTIPEEARWRHTYITGSSGSGKTELLKVLAHQTLSKHRGKVGLIIFDPHGDDMVRQLARHSRISDTDQGTTPSTPTSILDPSDTNNQVEPRNGDDVLLFDATLDPSGEQLPRFNPFDIPHRDNDRVIDFYAQHLSGALSELFDGEVSANMKVIGKACLQVLLRHEGSNLSDLHRFLDDERNEDLIAAGTRLPNPSDADFFRHGFHQSNLQPSKNALFVKLQIILGNHTFQRVTSSSSSFALEDWMNEKRILLFNLSKYALGPDGSEMLGRLLIASMKAIAYQRFELPSAQRPANHLIIDEFQNYVGQSSEEILSEVGRKCRLYLTLASQVPGQGMSSSFFQSIMTNTANKIVGTNTTKAYRAFSEEFNLPTESFQNLATGSFLFHTLRDSEGATQFRVPSVHVNHAGQASNAAWERFRQSQLDRFYPTDEARELPHFDSTTPTLPSEGSQDFTPAGDF